MAPMEAWFLLRSLRTLELRMSRHQQSAIQIARFLQAQPKVAHVFYPGLEDFEQRTLAQQQMTGFSGLMSFQLALEVKEQVKTFVDALRIFQIGVSWGGHESLVYAPAISYAKEQSAEQLEKMGITIANIRISVGLENVEDLQQDLAQALAQID